MVLSNGIFLIMDIYRLDFRSGLSTVQLHPEICLNSASKIIFFINQITFANQLTTTLFIFFAGEF